MAGGGGLRKIVICAKVEPHYGGFGMFDLGPSYNPDPNAQGRRDGFEDIWCYHGWMESDCGVTVEVYTDADGGTYKQGGNTIYKYTDRRGDTYFECCWLEDADEEEED